MQKWTTLSRQTVLDKSPFLKVELHAVRLPDGRVIPDWPWLVTPEYVNVVAETTDGRFICFRQTKYALQGEPSLAVVGGYVEPGEPFVDAVRRELLEETGYEAAEWIPLGTYVVDANRGAGRAHFFLARQARPVTTRSGGDLEEQEMDLLTRPEMEQALARGEFKVLAWTAIVAMALRISVPQH
jgi:ADP-ribose pyrophosphatase